MLPVFTSCKLHKQMIAFAVATKKTNELWLCRSCNEADDGEKKMICCDQCLEWFHW